MERRNIRGCVPDKGFVPLEFQNGTKETLKNVNGVPDFVWDRKIGEKMRADVADGNLQAGF
jgi:hypothetical protein